MALTIPSELAFVLNLLGFDWPELDEDEIHRAAHIMRQFSDDSQGTMDEVGARVTGDVPDAVTANAASSYGRVGCAAGGRRGLTGRWRMHRPSSRSTNGAA